MSKNASALASLTANYTDSENEDGHESDENNSPHTEESSESQVIFPPSSKPTTPVKTRSVNSTPSKVEAKSGLKLVSYHDDTVISDDDDDGDSSPNQDDVEMENMDDTSTEVKDNMENVEPNTIEPKRDRAAEYGFSLPPEPKGKCPTELQEKIANMYEKMRTNKMDMNKLIQERKEFRNPSIYEKLIQYCNINELGTNYPPELYDPMQWTGKESFYEELAKVQKLEMDKREKELGKNEIVQAATKKTEDESKKRKSKWDQPAPSAVAMQQQSNVIKSSGLITTSITGTKGTVISAFGSLPKKTKP